MASVSAQQDPFELPQRRHEAGFQESLSAVDPQGSEAVAFVEASLLMNVRADEYVAVFGLTQEGTTVPEANEKIAARIKEFTASLERLGVKTKNLSVRYQNRELLDEMRAAAAKSAIFDLAKVDYVVSDVTAPRARLLAEAAKVIKRKEADYATHFGVKMRPLSVDIERYDPHFPSEMYSSYSAEVSRERSRGKIHVVAQATPETLCYNPLNPADYDVFIGETALEPVVQFTLNLRMKYSVSR